MTKISNIPIEKFRKKVLDWFKNNKRPLPWRQNRTWYSVWISEVMLQQTQVEKVIAYYDRFIKRFPTLGHLVSTDLQTVLKFWEGMGYYSRAQNLYKAAHIIQEKYNGVLPDSVEDVSQLPGFGPYITNAVLSIAFNRPLAVVDGNVMRIISRIFKIDADIRLARVKKDIQEYMNELLDQDMPGRFNEAVMELGATLCLPQNPHCSRCPVKKLCRAFVTHTISQHPYKSPAGPKKIINALAIVCFLRKKVLIAQRPHQGLLGGFWEFPNYIISPDRSFDTISDSEIMQDIDSHAQHTISIQPIKHTYTHFQLNLYGRVYFIDRNVFSSAFYRQYKWVKLEEINHYPVHRAMTKMIERVKSLSEVIAK